MAAHRKSDRRQLHCAGQAYITLHRKVRGHATTTAKVRIRFDETPFVDRHE